MTRSVRLVLPHPPSANRYWRVFRGRATPSAEGVAYKEEVAKLCRVAGVGEPFTGPFRVVCHIFRPRKSRDLDNNPKVLHDALQGAVVTNDGKLVEMHFAHWDGLTDKGFVQVEVEEVLSRPPAPAPWAMEEVYYLNFMDAISRLEAVRGKVREGDRRRKARKAEQAQLATPAYRPPRKVRGLP